MQGPKLRVGKFEGGSVRLAVGQGFRLDTLDKDGDADRVSLPHPEIFAALNDETPILLDDGRIRLRVERVGDGFVDTTVMVGGELSNHKGVNLPNTVLDISPITEKDRADLAFGLDLGVDWVALSFVQKAADVAEARELVGGRAGILAKLEKPSAVSDLAEIVNLSDAIMVARGDLGVEVPPEQVPAIQKQIIRASRWAGKPVVVATQMLDSMITSPTPTRAEASDVATAVYDGADAVMLSAETAVGRYAVESVAMMNRIVTHVETDPTYRDYLGVHEYDLQPTTADAITAAAGQVAKTVSAAAIATFTSTGSTTLRAARERPAVPILGLAVDIRVARRLSLVWGVHPIQARVVKNTSDMEREAVRLAKRENYATRGDRIVVTAGVPFGTPGRTNILRIADVQ